MVKPFIAFSSLPSQAAQLRTLINGELEAAASAGLGTAVVLSGDMNSPPSEGTIPSLIADTGLTSAWGLPPPAGHFTTWKFRSNGEKQAIIGAP